MFPVILAEGTLSVLVRTDHDGARRRHLHHSGDETYRKCNSVNALLSVKANQTRPASFLNKPKCCF